MIIKLEFSRMKIMRMSIKLVKKDLTRTPRMTTPRRHLIKEQGKNKKIEEMIKDNRSQD